MLDKTTLAEIATWLCGPHEDAVDECYVTIPTLRKQVMLPLQEAVEGYLKARRFGETGADGRKVSFEFKTEIFLFPVDPADDKGWVVHKTEPESVLGLRLVLGRLWEIVNKADYGLKEFRGAEGELKKLEPVKALIEDITGADLRRRMRSLRVGLSANRETGLSNQTTFRADYRVRTPNSANFRRARLFATIARESLRPDLR